MAEPRERRVIDPVPAAVPEIARWLWSIEDTRRRTIEALRDLPPALLDWTPLGGANSIATLLYHIALIEADYLFADVLELPEDRWPAEIVALFPVVDRDAAGDLSHPPAESLETHLARLDRVRAHLRRVFATMTRDDFRRPRALVTYDTTPEWTLHHLMQHEAEHRGRIESIRALAARHAS